MTNMFSAVAIKFNFYYNLCFTGETMIAFLSGKILEKQANAVIVDVGGVGYEVTIPLSTFYEIGEVGEPIELRIYMHVREDAMQLFGFKTEREKQLYLKLISVQGIGAKSGVTMLSGMSADEIIVAIRTDNLARLTSIPGVGKKNGGKIGDRTARQIKTICLQRRHSSSWRSEALKKCPPTRFMMMRFPRC